MGRIKGSKNREGSKKPGRKPEPARIASTFTPDEILTTKLKVLELFESGKVTTLTAAAEKLSIMPSRLHHWSRSDKDFGSMVKLAREVAADKIEEEFQHHANFIPKMMLLKAYRPMFRDSYKFDVHNEALEKLLKELKELGQKPETNQEEEE